MRRLAFGLLLAFAFLIAWEETVVFPGLGTVSKVAGLAAAALWLASVLVSRSIRPVQLFHLASFAFFGWNFASMLWSVDPVRTLVYLKTYAQAGVLVLLVWDLCRQRNQVRAALQAYVLGGYVSALSTIFNYLSGHQAVWGRYAPTGFNPNTSAMLLALGIAMAWHLATSAEETWARRLKVLNYAYLPLALFAVSLTGSRFALFVSAPGLVFAAVSIGRIQGRLRIPVVVVLAGVLAAIPAFLPPSSRARLGSTLEEVTEGDLSGRAVIWSQGVEALSHHPLFGIGSGAFPAVIPSERSAHNSYLAVLVELGAVGFLLLGGVLAAVVDRAVRLAPGERAAWLVLLLSWALGNLALTWMHEKLTWLLLGLLVAQAATRPPSAEKAA